MKQIEDSKIRSVRANRKGWQIECWDLAKANQEFVVDRIYNRNLAFFEDLAAAYHYKTVRIHAKMIFVPAGLFFDIRLWEQPLRCRKSGARSLARAAINDRPLRSAASMTLPTLAPKPAGSMDPAVQRMPVGAKSAVSFIAGSLPGVTGLSSPTTR